MKLFSNRWDVLDAMQPGVWHKGFDLAKLSDTYEGFVHGRLSTLEDEGFVEHKTTETSGYGGHTIYVYRKTGKVRASPLQNLIPTF
ncbi:hypothetical protein Lumi_047 [Xylophilus phage Lumi]|nr:hypothetical protein Lumi_047 [Xylophilus phage Lumi]